MHIITVSGVWAQGVISRQWRRCLWAVTAVITILFPFSAQMLMSAPIDKDRDGLDDSFEQQLLIQFAPSFLIDANECDGLPAEFKPDHADPTPNLRNGTIYGQVFPVRSSASESTIEIHYYHLWANDCGRLGHRLDPEHVSVLISATSTADPAPSWRALYWYAAAHEDTLCEASSGAQASALKAEDRGAEVWISRGKHGSFLSHGKCRLGCGGDSCTGEMQPMKIAALINIGEPGAPLNGAVWIASSRWNLRSKMSSDFSESVLTRINEGSDLEMVASMNAPPPPTKQIILGGNSTLGALLTGNEWAGRSIVAAGVPSLQYAGRAVAASGRGLRAAGRKIFH